MDYLILPLGVDCLVGLSIGVLSIVTVVTYRLHDEPMHNMLSI